MPTTRSNLNIGQFEKVLQAIAHGLPKFTKVSTDDMTINFYCNEKDKIRRISVQFHAKTGKKGQWGA